jgi:hypothetical protein
MVCAAVVRLPAAVSLLLLEALFMQISGVSLALTWPLGFVYSEFSCAGASATGFPLSKHWGRWHCTHFLRPACLFTVHVGSGSSPLSCGVFLPPPLSPAFPLLVAGHAPLLLPSPARPGLFIYSSVRDSPPPAQHSGRPTLFPTCLVLFLLLSTQFLFFPWVEVGLSRGLCWSGPGLSVGEPRYC